MSSTDDTPQRDSSQNEVTALDTLGSWVRFALGDAHTRTFVETTYLNQLVENLHSFEETWNKRVIIMFTLILLYVLLATGSVTSIDLGVAEITDVQPIRKLLPALIGIYFVQMSIEYALKKRIERTYYAIIKNLYPAVFCTPLHHLVLPATVENFSLISRDIAQINSMGRRHEFMPFLIFMAYGLVVSSVPAFVLIWAIGELIRTYSLADPLVLVSVIIAALSCIIGMTAVTWRTQRNFVEI